jgi:predicted molibdopterin-dependent oxidoreductase YjgC
VVAIVGRPGFGDTPQLAEAVAAFARDVTGTARILPLHSRANTYGALDMGVAPDLLPGRVAAEHPGKTTREIMEGLSSGELRGVLLVGADPMRDMPDPRTAEEGLYAAEYVVAIDLFANDSNIHADVILPAAGFTEKEGTVTNVEGRVQKVNRMSPAPGSARADWSIFDDLSSYMDRPLGLGSEETIAKEISETVPLYTGVTHDYLEWEARDGVVVPIEGSQPFDHIPVVLAGPTAPGAQFVLHQARTMYDDGVRLRHSPSLRRLAPGAIAHLNPADAPGLGVTHGAAVTLTTSQGEGLFRAVLDPETPPGVLYVPFNQKGAASLGTDLVVRIKVVTW